VSDPRPTLRPAAEADLAFVMAAERDPEASPYITVQPRERHLAALASEDEELLIFELEERPVAYARVAGLASRHRNVEIQTLVVTERGRGIGAAVLRAILKRAFGRGAHRVWLDAIGTNARARRTYARVGFVEEGAMREAWQLPDGSFDSIVLMSMLDREWAEREGASPG
jgi:RimJ/RimL family protein N-acetyltransferase